MAQTNNLKSWPPMLAILETVQVISDPSHYYAADDTEGMAYYSGTEKEWDAEVQHAIDRGLICENKEYPGNWDATPAGVAEYRRLRKEYP